MRIYEKIPEHDSLLFDGDAADCASWVRQNTPVSISLLSPHMMRQITAANHPEWPPAGWSEQKPWLVGCQIEDRLVEIGGFESAVDALTRGLSRVADGRIYAI